MIKRIPEYITKKKQLKEKLQENDVQPLKASRMISIIKRERGATKKIAMVVNKDRAQRPRTAVKECYRCQKFGHGQENARVYESAWRHARVEGMPTSQ